MQRREPLQWGRDLRVRCLRRRRAAQLRRCQPVHRRRLQSNGRLPAHPLADGTVCGEGNACTVGQRCHAGGCTAGAPLNCDDGIACTADACVSGTGCVHTVADGPAGVLCVWTVARQSNACAGASVPPSADRHVRKAAGLIHSALTTSRPPRAPRCLGTRSRRCAALDRCSRRRPARARFQLRAITVSVSR
jgi:hypothetical protein